MSKFVDDCGKNGGVIGLLLKWLLTGGPQRKPGKPQKTFAFRFLWFITVVPLLFIVALFLFAKDGNISNLKPEYQQYFNIACGVLIVDIVLWILRAFSMKKKKKTQHQPMSEDQDDPDE